VVRMRACTSSVAMLTSGSLRDCGSGAFWKPHGESTNSTDGARTGAQLNGARYGSAPQAVSPRPLSAAWGEACKERKEGDSVCTVTRGTYGSPSQTAESPHCLSDPILSLSQRASLALRKFWQNILDPAEHAAPSYAMSCNGGPRTGRAW
jgi:hypothetical protein